MFVTTFFTSGRMKIQGVGQFDGAAVLRGRLAGQSRRGLPGSFMNFLDVQEEGKEFRTEVTEIKHRDVPEFVFCALCRPVLR
jgi:hypothetical protein